MAQPNEDLVQLNLLYTFPYKGLTITFYKGNVGEGLRKHQHEDSHLTVISSGKVCIRKENVYKELVEGDLPINLKENEWHEIEILEDNTTFFNVM
jgi:quercetin dioxygenase-like cupin family protein